MNRPLSPRILVARRIFPEVVERLRVHAEVVWHDEDRALTPSELVAVSPGRKLARDRAADAYQLRAVTQLRQSHLVGTRPQSRLAKGALARLDRLPALLDGGEVPSLAAATHRPQPPLRCIEGESSPDGHLLDAVVRGEGGGAPGAGGQHAGIG